ncbi:hypothetical protein AO738_04110 [Pseudomonas citronellolis]|nr:hypothetical protein AO742_18530 [Pseudomonas citronellolis]KRW77722.1 hypothetical protein AO738_04110 [Pseudomonas citronellolis]
MLLMSYGATEDPGDSMSVVAGDTAYAGSASTSVTALVPAGAEANDLLLAFVVTFHSIISAPAGWTLVDSQVNPFAGGGLDTILSIYSKTALSGDTGASATWSYGTAQVSGAVILAIHKANSTTPTVDSTAKSTQDLSGSTFAAAPITASNGQMIIASQCAIYALTGTPTSYSCPPGLTQHTPSSVNDNRLCVGSKVSAAGESFTGNFTNNGYGGAVTQEVSSISLVISP